jgi:hypothetical protein
MSFAPDFSRSGRPSTESVAVRPSAIAGAWYPGSAAALRRTIEDFFAAVPPAAQPRPALVYT